MHVKDRKIQEGTYDRANRRRIGRNKDHNNNKTS